SAPPPRRDHYCLEKTLPSTVISVDLAFRDSVKRHLDAIGVRYVLPPKDVYDEDGFLRDEFAMKAPRDSHHGNAAYGKLMIKEVLTFQACQEVRQTLRFV